MKLKAREAIIGLIVYRVARYMVRRWLTKKGGGIMAGKRKYAIIAAITAALGALMFWRRRKKGQEAA